MDSSAGSAILKLSDLDKMLDVSTAWFLYLKNADNNNANFIGLLED